MLLRGSKNEKVAGRFSNCTDGGGMFDGCWVWEQRINKEEFVVSSKQKVSMMPFCYVGQEGKSWGSFQFEDKGLFFVPKRGDAFFIPYDKIVQVVSRSKNLPNPSRVVIGLVGSGLIGGNEFAVVYIDIDDESQVHAVKFREKSTELTNQIKKAVRVINEERDRFLAQSGIEAPVVPEEIIARVLNPNPRYVKCPKCEKRIHRSAKKCRHCGYDTLQK